MSDQLFSFPVHGLYIGSKSPYSSAFESLTATPIEGVESASITLDYPRVSTMGWDGDGEPVLVQRPRANLDFTYVFASGVNEGNLGFSVGNGIPALIDFNSERNYYLMSDKDHLDLFGYNGTNSIAIAFGNGLIKRYAFQSAVGRLTTVGVTVEALNLLLQASGGSGQILPAVSKQVGSAQTGTYVLPGFTQKVASYYEASPFAISLTFDSGCAVGTALSGNLTCALQSFDFTIDLPRLESKQLGWAYPDNRPLDWPVTIGIRADAILNGMQSDALNRLNCADSGWAFNVGFANACRSMDTFGFQFVGAKLDSQTFTAQIDGSDHVSFAWSVKIYDINRTSGAANFYVNGHPGCQPFTTVVFPQVSYGTGVGQLPLTISIPAASYITIVSGPGIISGCNNVLVTDQPGSTIVVAVNVSGSSEQQLITLNVS